MPVECMQGARDGAQQSVASERHRDLVATGRVAGELARVLEAAGRLHAVLESRAG